MAQNLVARAVLVGVLAALGFLALNAATGGLDTADYITAVGVAIGGGAGYHYGVRRKERRDRAA